MQEKAIKLDESIFEPDFNYWWKNPNLSFKQLCWLLYDLDPDGGEHYLELEAQLYSLSQKQQECIKAIENYSPSAYHVKVSPQKIDELRQKLCTNWLGDRISFIEELYQMRFSFPPKFYTYLKALNPSPIPTWYEQYADYSNYLCTSNVCDIDTGNKNEVFAFLLGLEPEYFSRFVKLYMPNRHLLDVDGYKLESPDDYNFICCYCEFLRSHTNNSCITGMVFKALKSIPEPSDFDSIENYANHLYNNGIIFSNKALAHMAMADIYLSIDKESRLFKFFRSYIKTPSISLENALNIFTSNQLDKIEGFPVKIYDFGESSYYLSNSQLGKGLKDWHFYQPDKGDVGESHGWNPIVEHLKLYVIAGDIEQHIEDGEAMFNTEVIFKWLLKHTLRLPHPMIVDLMGAQENSLSSSGNEKTETEEKDADIDENFVNTNTKLPQKISKNPGDDWKKDIERAFIDYMHDNQGEMPKGKALARHMNDYIDRNGEYFNAISKINWAREKISGFENKTILNVPSKSTFSSHVSKLRKKYESCS